MNQIYHYKQGFDWIPFELDEVEGKKWNVFCLNLSLTRPDYPNPEYSDYIRFLSEINKEDKTNEDMAWKEVAEIILDYERESAEGWFYHLKKLKEKFKIIRK